MKNIFYTITLLLFAAASGSNCYWDSQCDSNQCSSTGHGDQGECI